MEVSSQIVPAIIVLVANLLSGKHGSLRWETVTAVFGWLCCISIVGYILIAFVSPEHEASGYLLQIASFSLITALARDYERVLRPLFPWNR